MLQRDPPETTLAVQEFCSYVSTEKAPLQLPIIEWAVKETWHYIRATDWGPGESDHGHHEKIEMKVTTPVTKRAS